MIVYVSSISTNEYAIERRAYKSISSSLKYIYDNLKSLSIEYIEDCDFFDRDYIKNYFTEDYFERFIAVSCKSTYGELSIKYIYDGKYQFVFAPYAEYTVSHDACFIVCELDMLELLN